MLNHSNYNNKQRLFTIYIYYRLAMSVLLTVLFLSGLGKQFLGIQSPSIFAYTGYAYIFVCLLSAAMHATKVLSPKNTHIIWILVIDFIALTQMIFTSNNIIGGLGYLLLIPMAIGGTFLRGKTSVALAAFTSLLIIFNSAINSLSSSSGNEYLLAAGLTGIILFITAIVFRLLSKRLEYSEEQFEKQAERAEHLQNISQHIIETMQSGIIVINSQYQILLINDAAKMLAINHPHLKKPQYIPEVKNVLDRWKINKPIVDNITLLNQNNDKIKITFTSMPDNQINAIILLIEDNKHIQQQAQQIKLASLGRLTSSIAHEIRNPLGAISHASQLLDESESITPNDQELLRMIQVNSQRIDQTISNILQFSRRKQSSQEMINLCEWIKKFKGNYQPQKKSSISISFEKNHIYGRIDPSHLHQIMTNLVDNGLTHGKREQEKNTIHLSIYIDPKSSFPIIDIEDEGDGIKEENLKNIFEPFFTTKSQGSGLGLYLCKELCEANQTDITYLQKTNSQRSCFRLTFNNSTQKPINNEK
ncbi:sensor histidine kinase [Eionea flava]